METNVKIETGQNLTISVTPFGEGLEKLAFTLVGNNNDQLIDKNETNDKVSFLIPYNLLDGKQEIKINLAYSGNSTYALFTAADSNVITKTISLNHSSTKSSSSIFSLSFPAFPNYMDQDATPNEDANSRVLIVDMDPSQNNQSGLYRLEEEEEEEEEEDKDKEDEESDEGEDFFHRLETTTCIDQYSHVTVVVRSYYFNDVSALQLKIAGKDYNYESSIQDLYEGISPDQEDDGSDPGESNQEAELNNSTDGSNTDLHNHISIYLDTVYQSLVDKPVWSLTEVRVLNAYQRQLSQLANTDDLKGAPSDLLMRFNQIVHWYPEYIVISEIPVNIQKGDKVEISVDITKEGNTTAQNYPLGSYWLKGGWVPHVDARIYVTGLANNEVYRDSVATSDTTNEYRLQRDGTNKTSIGIGIAGDIEYRTGSPWRPMISTGFMVPFDDESNIIFTMGAGISLSGENVRLSLTAGPAYGRVTTILDRYSGVDISNYDDVEITDMTTNAWRLSWQCAIGFSYNLE